MFVVYMLLPSDDIPNEVSTSHETLGKAITDADRMIKHYGGARKLEIYESPTNYFSDGKLVVSLRTIK